MTTSSSVALQAQFDAYHVHWRIEEQNKAKEYVQATAAHRGCQSVEECFHSYPNDHVFRFMVVRATITLEDEQALATMPYRDFLATDYWKLLRAFVFALRGTECVLCDRDDSPQLHHRHYRDRGREWMYWESCLTILCRHCHAKFHDKIH